MLMFSERQKESQSVLKLLVYTLALLVVTAYASGHKHQRHQQPFQGDMAPLNVLKQPLALFSRQPMTGFHRDGYCRTSAGDFGSHAVAGIVTEEFLDFSARQGNDLRSIGGMQGGCKWCLCTGRWFEAYQAYKDGRIGKEAVPKVDLSATEDSALNKVDLSAFREFAAESQSNGAS